MFIELKDYQNSIVTINTDKIIIIHNYLNNTKKIVLTGKEYIIIKNEKYIHLMKTINSEKMFYQKEVD